MGAEGKDAGGGGDNVVQGYRVGKDRVVERQLSSRGDRIVHAELHPCLGFTSAKQSTGRVAYQWPSNFHRI